MFIIPIEKRIDWQRPPIILLGIIFLNILVFWFYQGLDESRGDRAINAYKQSQLLELELPAYQQYLVDQGLEEIDENDEYLEYYILSDSAFTDYLSKNAEYVIFTTNHSRWLSKRNEVNELWSKVSYEAYGLKPSNIKPVALISYQFLHGDLMHLLGNMVFLFLIGFAVEAALGSIRFLAFYLISGVGSGLFFAGIESLSLDSSFVSLVGASGSVSGVLAMYLALFRLRKIKFFYWILVFTGYFRSVALIILPIYIGKEVYFYFLNDGSNVAYTAHIGGFISGVILVLLTQSLSTQSIDKEYLDNDEKQLDPYLVELNELYKQMGQCNFRKARNHLLQLKNRYGTNSELIEIEFNLVIAINQHKLDAFLIEHLGKTQNNPLIITSQLELWNKLSVDQCQSISFEKKYLFAIDLLLINQVRKSEEIFKDLQKGSTGQNDKIAILARKIAVYFQNSNNHQRAKSYDQQARDLMQLSV